MSNTQVLPTWTFERSGPMGGAAGEAFTNPLAASGMPRAAVLAREAVQNSVDASENGGKVLVRFREHRVVGEEKIEFVKTANLAALASRQSAILAGQPNCLSAIDDEQSEISLLYVEDHRTTGLEGDFNTPSSKFYRFLLSLGDGGKIRESHGSGGSFGFGKSVYSSNSAINTIYAYSKTRDQDGKIRSIIFGCGYFKSHEVGNDFHTGRAWFGRDVTFGEAAYQKVEPLVGKEADELAISLGFKLRKDSDLGTSVLIVDSSIDLDEVLSGVEDWWWPRIISNELDIQVVSANGSKTMPRPRIREHLKPFIEAYEVCTTQAVPRAGIELRKPFNRMENLSLGVCALKVLDKDADGNLPVTEDRVDSIALMRAPKMVVAYYRAWNAGNPPLAGVYVADDDVDDILRSAESPAHDKWDLDSARLRDAEGNNRAVVDSILRRLRSTVKDFQRLASPPPPPRPRKLGLLERNLANFLSPSKGGPEPGPDHPSAPIHLNYDSPPELHATEEGMLEMVARFGLKLKEDSDDEELDVRIKVTCAVVADGSDVDPIMLEMSTQEGELEVIDKESGLYRARLSKDTAIKLTAKSAPYDPNWTIRFIPEVEPVELEQ
ncbi:hypothetical protein [Qipengyuania gaetbuli]|uniref:hypothetical protein n=1 Tax=Qipengyuania gaetbuli TaxID=266952 RepID=UPI001CD4127A|nr:hypothetical protein [Qipengyuania gaetbuli]MCA0910073.1 hypothetical protein [Qipengyuania gaetbuli]